jgi:hypothetical protein
VELGRTRKEMVVAYFDVLFPYMPGRNMKNHETDL